MNRINQLFNEKKTPVLSLYFCAGTPVLNGTADVIRTLEKKGIDMIEIGIPFSDPMADGPVIQDAATKALRNGMTPKLLMSQLKDIRRRPDSIGVHGLPESNHAIRIRTLLSGLSNMWN